MAPANFSKNPITRNEDRKKEKPPLQAEAVLKKFVND